MTDWWSFGQGAAVGAVGGAAAVYGTWLARKADRRDLADRSAAAAEQERRETAEAALIDVTPHGNGGSIQLSITNSSHRPVTKLELLDIASDPPVADETWKYNPNISQRTRYREVLPPGEKTSIYVWLLDANGEHRQGLPGGVTYGIRFRDAGGQWWKATDEGDPARIDAP